MTTPTPRDSIISPGEPAPLFTLPDQDRRDWSLADHAASGDVLLAFYPFAFTSVCGTEMMCVTEHFKAVRDAGKQVVGISTDSPAANKAWAERDGYTHPLLSDLHRTVVRGYGLHWADLNVGQRGSVIVGPDDHGGVVVKFSQARDPGEAMDWEAVASAFGV